MVTLQQAKDYLQVTTTANDVIIQSFIDYVESEIETYCDTKFSTATYTDEVLSYSREFFDQQFNPALDVRAGRLRSFTKYTPIQSIVEIDANGTTLVEADDYLVDEEIGEITFLKYYDAEDRTLKITYIAGYLVIPPVLTMIALQGVKQMYEGWSVVTAGQKEVESKSVGDFSVKYSADSITVGQSIFQKYMAENLSTLNKFAKWGL